MPNWKDKLNAQTRVEPIAPEAAPVFDWKQQLNQSSASIQENAAIPEAYKQNEPPADIHLPPLDWYDKLKDVAKNPTQVV